jgi:predicted RNA-binding Zn-ribbon protein involved in translation (DUF1610 family)
MINCPTTGAPVPTGRDVAEAVAEVEGHASDSDELLWPCPSCGKVHVWRARDAWAEGA